MTIRLGVKKITVYPLQKKLDYTTGFRDLGHVWIYGYVFLKISCFFPRHCYMPVFPVITMQMFVFKNSIIVTKLFLVMVLDLYLTSE